MLIEEAKWLGRRMGERTSEDLSPLLDVGSSTETFRRDFQPWVCDDLYDPLKARGIVIKHQDIKPLPGVDIVGDLTDTSFIAELGRQSFGSVLCANVLEHVQEPHRIAQALVEIVPVGGYLFISCPHKFPYHPDPMDYRFRPDVDRLARLFPSTEVVSGEIVVCRTYFDHLYPRGKAFAKLMVRLCLPFYQPRLWALKVLHLPWLFRRLEATCLVLRKTE